MRAKIFISLAVLLALSFLVYIFGIEPYWIEVTRHSVAADIKKPLKIAHLTDLHTHGLGRRERKVLEILNDEKPDAIMITGDTNVAGANYQECKEILSQLHAPQGVWLVRGN